MQVIKGIQAKNILSQLVKEAGVDKDNVYIEPKHGYIVTVDNSKKDVDHRSTTYKGSTYTVQYISGCFYPFIVCTGKA